MPQGYGGYGANNTNLGRGTARGQAGRMYLGGSPNFDEVRGAYRNFRDRTIPGRPGGGVGRPPFFPQAPAQQRGFFGGGPEGYALRQAYQAARAAGNPMDPRLLRGKINRVQNPRDLETPRPGPEWPPPGQGGGGRGGGPTFPRNPGPMPPNRSGKAPTQRGGPMESVPGQSGRYGGINPGGMYGGRASRNPMESVPGQSGRYGGINPGGMYGGGAPIAQQQALLQLLMGLRGRM